MGQGMGSDFHASAKPVPDLGRIHEPLRHIALGDVPVVGLSEAIGHEELNGLASVAGKDRQRVFEHIGKTVVEGQDGLGSGSGLAGPGLEEGGADEARPA